MNDHQEAGGKCIVTLGPDDYLLMTTRVHIMRRQPDEDGRRVWRIACGTRMSPETWESIGWTPPPDEISRHNIATCSRCFVPPVATPTEENPNQ